MPSPARQVTKGAGRAPQVKSTTGPTSSKGPRVRLLLLTLLAFAVRLQLFLTSDEPTGWDGYSYVVQIERLVSEGRLHWPDASWVTYFLAAIHFLDPFSDRRGESRSLPALRVGRSGRVAPGKRARVAPRDLGRGIANAHAPLGRLREESRSGRAAAAGARLAPRRSSVVADRARRWSPRWRIGSEPRCWWPVGLGALFGAALLEAERSPSARGGSGTRAPLRRADLDPAQPAAPSGSRSPADPAEVHARTSLSAAVLRVARHELAAANRAAARLAGTRDRHLAVLETEGQRRAELGALLLPLLVCVFPLWRTDTLDVGYRLALMAPIFAIPLLSLSLEGGEGWGEGKSGFRWSRRHSGGHPARAKRLRPNSHAPVRRVASADHPHIPGHSRRSSSRRRGSTSSTTTRRGTSHSRGAPSPASIAPPPGGSRGTSPMENGPSWAPASSHSPRASTPKCSTCAKTSGNNFSSAPEDDDDDGLQSRLADWKNPSKVRPQSSAAKSLTRSLGRPSPRPSPPRGEGGAVRCCWARLVGGGFQVFASSRIPSCFVSGPSKNPFGLSTRYAARNDGTAGPYTF